MKILWYSLKKSKFSFNFIVYTPMHVSDVITNVTKQNMNVMASMPSAFKTCKTLEKTKKKVPANKNNFDTNMFLTF